MEFVADMGGVAQLGEAFGQLAGAVGGVVVGVIAILVVVLFAFTVWMLVWGLKSNHTAVGTTSGRGAGMLITLCVLSICWALFGILRGLLYEFIAFALENSSYWRGSAFIFLNTVILGGSIAMICRKFTGLIIYTIAQGLNVLLIFYTIYVYSPGFDFFAVLIGAIFFLPPILFIVFLWLPGSTRSFVRTV
jgi:hypothetical protein